MDEFETYIAEPVAPARRGRTESGLALYLGFAVLLAAASLVAVNSRGGTPSKFPRVLVPGSSAACTSPPNGFLFSQFVDGTQMNVCISQQGNINQINYPDTAAGHTQIAWDGYCLHDSPAHTDYTDFSPGSGVASAGWGAATLTQTASNTFNMTRTSTDNKYQLTEFIKVNFQPRSIFVGMTVKNVDPANVTHSIFVTRSVAPAIDGSAADDQYNEFGVTTAAAGFGRTGQASQSPGPGTNSLLFGPTQDSGFVVSATVAQFQSGNGCFIYSYDLPGPVSGGNRVLRSQFQNSLVSISPGASAQTGKFVYRMM